MRGKLFGSRLRKVITVTAVMCMLGGGAALAAFLAEGQGSTTSTETTGNGGSAAVVVVATNNTDALTPGGPVGNIGVQIENQNAFSVNVSNLVVAVTGTSAGSACAASNFTVTQATTYVQTGPGSNGNPYSLGAVIPAGDALNSMGNGGVPATLALNSGAPQTCAGVTVNLSETAS